MGYDERHPSSSSGVLVAVVVSVLIVALLGVLAVLGSGILFARNSRMEAMVARERVVAELHRAVTEAQQEVEEARVEATPDPRLTFMVDVDREGVISHDGEPFGLDELSSKLAKFQNETHNAFFVRINVDSECPVKHVIPVLDACEEVGNIDYRVVAYGASESSDASNAEN